MTISAYDSAWPDNPAPAGDQVVMGYIGGDTPHVWSLADWNSQPARYRIPIWTRDNPGGYSGTTEAQAALAKLDSLGAPRGITVVIDFELAQDADYVLKFDAVMVAAGNKTALYGSKSTLFNNPRPSAGYFPADLTGVPHLYPGTLLTQYQFESNWDDDVVSSSLPLWDTRTQPAPIPVPVPVSTSEDDEDMPQQIESLATHPTGEYVFAFPRGKYHEVAFVADDFGGPDAVLRVVFWTLTGPTVHDGVKIPSGSTVLGFADAAHTYAVTVRREDSGSHPIGIALS